MLLPGVADPLVEPLFGLFWDEVVDCPLRSLPIAEVSLDEPVLADGVAVDALPVVLGVDALADPCMLPLEPCVETWPWLPAALCVPSTEPCVEVPVVDVFDAVRVSLFEPEHATSSAAAPMAVTT